ncbi:MAG TPA: DUF1152 domain-containing protein [Gemmataceae bacterium]|nr:DUF1152 domain-containing protein [Gemmataceae bacterium]
MHPLHLPFFDELDRARTILLAGAGGGYDVFSGLPLYFGLRRAGKTVHLANLSFTHLEHASGRRLAPALLEVTADSEGSKYYFPEGYLSQWFRAQGEEVPIYCFDRTGVGPIRRGYEVLLEQLGPDTIILVDGGTDSLMRGDEVDLGTPHEDIASIAAVDDLPVPRKLLVCTAFGVDHFHGVCHAYFLEAVAELTRAGAHLGTFSLMKEMPEVQKARAATLAVFRAMPDHVSIVASSVLNAIEGWYGDVHATSRTAGSALYINPLMGLYWCFQLRAVAQRILYLDAVKKSETFIDVDDAIENYRMTCKHIRPWIDLPM